MSTGAEDNANLAAHVAVLSEDPPTDQEDSEEERTRAQKGQNGVHKMKEEARQNEASSKPDPEGTYSDTEKEAPQAAKEKDIEAIETIKTEENSPQIRKRTPRQRNRVVLMQDQYEQMYDPANNRKLRDHKPSPHKPSAANANNNTSRPSSVPVDSNTTSTSSVKKSTRQRKSVILLQDQYAQIYDNKNNRMMSKRKEPPAKSLNTKKKRAKMERLTPIYRWVGHCKVIPSTSNTYFKQIEIRVGNHPALINVGDYVLLNSGATDDDDDLYDSVIPLNGKSNATVAIRRSIGGKPKYAGGQSGQSKTSVAMNSLNPYVGLIENFWEEAGKKGRAQDRGQDVEYSNDRRSKMKVKVRWLYKASDIKLLKGEFTGLPKEEILSRMSPRDMIMGYQSDVNEVACLLGKCRVLRRMPHKRPLNKDQVKGAFLCQYNLVTTPGTKSSPHGTVNISAYSGPDQFIEDIIPSTKKKTQPKDEGEETDNLLCNESLDSNGKELNSGAGRDDDLSQSSMNVDNNADLINSESIEADDGAISDGSLSSDTSESDQKRPPLAEGSVNSGKIEVGENHQAVIPDLVENGQYAFPRARPLQKVWEPNKIDDQKLDNFLEEVVDVLEAYTKEKGLDISRSLPDMSASSIDKPEQSWFREFDKQKILSVLHQNEYDCSSTLLAIKAQPMNFITFWSRRDKELFNAGFQRHFSNLRMIKKDIGDSKNHKDVVDYHYRFKIPEQFVRYQDKKREQARRMMESIESHRLEEYLSSDVKPKKSSNSNTSGPKRVKNWSRNGGEPNSIGAAEARRLGAKDFLLTARDTLGPAQYLILVNYLKALNARTLTIPQLKEGFGSVLQDHPILLEKFKVYLPKKFRN